MAPDKPTIFEAVQLRAPHICSPMAFSLHVDGRMTSASPFIKALKWTFQIAKQEQIGISLYDCLIYDWKRMARGNISLERQLFTVANKYIHCSGKDKS